MDKWMWASLVAILVASVPWMVWSEMLRRDLRHAVEDRQQMAQELAAERRWTTEARETSEANFRYAKAAWATVSRLTDALHDIAAMETEKANATVRRMAAKAREATGEVKRD